MAKQFVIEVRATDVLDEASLQIYESITPEKRGEKLGMMKAEIIRMFKDEMDDTAVIDADIRIADTDDAYKATCCGKEISYTELALNHGMCNKCMDGALLVSNLKNALNESITLLHSSGQYVGSNIAVMDEFERLLSS
jgi:Zn finger protein HypA/HybF involved in hydrogenase expression